MQIDRLQKTCLIFININLYIDWIKNDLIALN